MVAILLIWAAIILGCLFSEGLRVIIAKAIIKVVQFVMTFIGILFKGLRFGLLKILNLSIATSVIVGSTGVVASPFLDYKLSDITKSDVRYVENYWDIFNSVGKEKNINPLLILSIVKVEGGVRKGELVNPSNGQGIGQLYSWVVVAKRYYFPPGPLSKEEAEKQIKLIAVFLTQKCGDLNISYDAMVDVSDDVFWDRVACFERYNGVRGGVRGDMSTYPAVFNNLPGYPKLRGMLIPNGDLSSTLVPMRQDGYETVYRKFSSYLASSKDKHEKDLLPDLTKKSEKGDLGEIKNFRPVATIPYSLNNGDCSSYVKPGELGPQIVPILESNWSVSQGCHEALAVDLFTPNGKATLVSPIEGVVTAIYNDGYCGPYGCGNSVVVIENKEWLTAFLHYKAISVDRGQVVNVGDTIAKWAVWVTVQDHICTI